MHKSSLIHLRKIRKMMIMASVSLLLLSTFKILELGIRFYNYLFPSFYISLRHFLRFFLAKWNLCRTRTRKGTRNNNTKVAEEGPLEKLIDGEISMEELKLVMSRLGMANEEGDDDIENPNIGVNEFSAILLDEEPSLLEIKQVFQVFDENKDGFIDATELQRVLSGLCLEEGSELEECRKMVCAFDEDGDGFLDFEDFLAFMEKYFC